MIQTRTATARRTAAGSGPAGAPGSSGTADGSAATGGTGASRRPDRAEAGSWPVRERSLLKPVLGIPPLAAVGLAIGLTAVGVLVDLLRLGTVGTVFQIGYGTGCLLAVVWVRRRSVFLPAIQPPLLLAVVVPALAVLVGAPSSTAGITEHLLLAGAPLINAFPAMAVTTVLVLLVAGFRLLRQRTGPDDAVGSLRRRLSGRATDSSGSAENTTSPDHDGGSSRTRPDPARTDREDHDRPAGGRSARGRPARGRTGRDGPAAAADRDSGRRGAPGDGAGGTERTSGGRRPSARTAKDASGRNSTATSRGSASSPDPASSKPASSKPASSKPASSKPASSNPVPGAARSGRSGEATARKRPPDVRSAGHDAEDGRAGGSKRSGADPSDAGRRTDRSASGRERSNGRDRGSRSGRSGDGTRSGRPRRDTP